MTIKKVFKIVWTTVLFWVVATWAFGGIMFVPTLIFSGGDNESTGNLVLIIAIMIYGTAAIMLYTSILRRVLRAPEVPVSKNNS